MNKIRVSKNKISNFDNDKVIVEGNTINFNYSGEYEIEYVDCNDIFLIFNINGCNIKLCEIFMFLCDEKRCLDTCIYEKILNFKNEFIENYKYINFFGFKTAELSNKEELSKQLLEIIKKITLKIKELSN